MTRVYRKKCHTRNPRVTFAEHQKHLKLAKRRTTKNAVSRSEGTQNLWRVGASELSVSAEQTSRFRHTQQLHKNEIGLDDIVFQSCNLDEHYKHEKYQVSGSCNRSCSSFDALHFLFFALMAWRASPQWVSYRRFLSKVLEDFLKVMIAGDLHIVVVQICPRTSVRHTSHRCLRV